MLLSFIIRLIQHFFRNAFVAQLDFFFLQFLLLLWCPTNKEAFHDCQQAFRSLSFLRLFPLVMISRRRFHMHFLFMQNQNLKRAKRKSVEKHLLSSLCFSRLFCFHSIFCHVQSFQWLFYTLPLFPFFFRFVPFLIKLCNCISIFCFFFSSFPSTHAITYAFSAFDFHFFFFCYFVDRTISVFTHTHTWRKREEFKVHPLVGYSIFRFAVHLNHIASCCFELQEDADTQTHTHFVESSKSIHFLLST